MRLTLFTIFTLGFVSILLSGCSTHIQEKAALEFEPIYPNELDIPLPSKPTGGIYSEAKGGLFATDKRATVVGDILKTTHLPLSVLLVSLINKPFRSNALNDLRADL